MAITLIEPKHGDGETILDTEGNLNKHNNANLKKKTKTAERRKTKKQNKKLEVKTDRETNNEPGNPFHNHTRTNCPQERSN